METLLLTEKSQNTERREGGTGAVPGWYSKALDFFPRSKRKRRTRGRREHGGRYVN